MKKYKIAFWITTVIIFLAEGIMPILTTHSPMAVAGMTALGYPVYFVTMLPVFKLLGALALIIPMVPARVKEWAYAGFAIDFLSALISILVVGTLGSSGFLFPLVAIIILVISYVSYHKTHKVFA